MLVYTIAILVIAIDQVLKYIVKHAMYEGQSITLLDHVLAITSIRNPGAAFGMLQHQRWLFIVVALLVILAGVIFERRTARSHRHLLRLAIGLMVGGAVGNLIDRMLYKTVVDYVNVQVFVFNFADAAITIAVGLILWDAVRQDRSVSNPLEQAKDE
jgi:signal peptidase II